MKILAGKPQVELEPRYQSLYPLLRREQCQHVVFLQSCAFLTDEYVVHVDEDHTVKTQTELAV